MFLWRDVFYLDHRSIRLMRLLLGVALLMDATLFAAFEVEWFLSDSGILPRDHIFRLNEPVLGLSVFSFSGSPAWSYFCLALMALAGVLLIFNRIPHWAAVLGLVIKVSLNHRASVLTLGGDQLQVVLCIWSALLPARPGPNEGSRHRSVAAVGVLLQVALLYLVAGFTKSSLDWLWQPHAVHVALETDALARPLAHWIRPFNGLEAVASILVLLVERFGWLAFFVGGRSERWRTWSVLAFMLMHGIFGMFLYIGLFPLLNIALLAAILPTAFWDRFRGAVVFMPTSAAARPGSWRLEVSTGLAIIMTAFICIWNLALVSGIRSRFPEPVRIMVQAMGIGQTWILFAPRPSVFDAHYVFEGHTRSGGSVDVLRGKAGPPDFSKPRNVADYYPSPRWMELASTLTEVSDEKRRLLTRPVVDYFCRSWNSAGGGEPIVGIRVWQVMDYTIGPWLPPETFRRLVNGQACGPPSKNFLLGSSAGGQVLKEENVNH